MKDSNALVGDVVLIKDFEEPPLTTVSEHVTGKSSRDYAAL